MSRSSSDQLQSGVIHRPVRIPRLAPAEDRARFSEYNHLTGCNRRKLGAQIAGKQRDAGQLNRMGLVCPDDLRAVLPVTGRFHLDHLQRRAVLVNTLPSDGHRDRRPAQRLRYQTGIGHTITVLTHNPVWHKC